MIMGEITTGNTKCAGPELNSTNDSKEYHKLMYERVVITLKDCLESPNYNLGQYQRFSS